MYLKIKRILDFTFSLLGLIVISPLLLLLLPFVFVSNGGSLFFTQTRPGKKGHLFRIVKFKTMKDKYDPDGNLLPDNERITVAGRIIRSLSLDELPQLICVIKGDMSLVGPRPLLTDYLPLYNERQARRHEVRPGITGWAQVNGRNAITWEEKFELDVWYVENISFWLDIKILWLTLLKVIRREGINSASAATMERFGGSAENGKDILG